LPAGCTLPAASQETDAGGAYALSLSAGAYRVTVSGDDLATATHAINVAGPRSDLDFTLTPNCCDIFGYVRDAAGRPINDAYVRVMSGPDRDSVFTGDCGRFGLLLNQPGSYTVRAYADGYVPVSRTLTVSSSRPDLDFTLTRLPGGDATVLCTVRDQAGQPVMGARIWVGPAGMNYSSSDSRRTNAAGQLSLVLPPGVYDLYADRDCYADAAPVRVTTPPGASINLTLHVGTNRIAGRITDQSGASVFGAGLYAWDAAGRRGSDYATSDSNGNYLLRVAPGSWSVRVYPPSTCNYAYPLPLVLTVPPDRTNANFVLQAGAATPTPTATPPAGQPEVWMPLILKRR
jgi:protocatechuate 3,4-dioxygenase beta subunit